VLICVFVRSNGATCSLRGRLAADLWLVVMGHALAAAQKAQAICLAHQWFEGFVVLGSIGVSDALFGWCAPSGQSPRSVATLSRCALTFYVTRPLPWWA